jgi:hypothetical protein
LATEKANANIKSESKGYKESTNKPAIGTSQVIQSLVEVRGPSSLFQSADITFLTSGKPTLLFLSRFFIHANIFLQLYSESLALVQPSYLGDPLVQFSLTKTLVAVNLFYSLLLDLQRC